MVLATKLTESYLIPWEREWPLREYAPGKFLDDILLVWLFGALFWVTYPLVAAEVLDMPRIY